MFQLIKLVAGGRNLNDDLRVMRTDKCTRPVDSVRLIVIQFLEYGGLSQIFPKLITGFLLASADVISPRFAVESQGSFMGETA